MPMSIYSIFKYRIKVLTEESTNYLYQILPTHSLVPSVAGGLSGGCRVVKGAGLKIRSRCVREFKSHPPHQSTQCPSAVYRNYHTGDVIGIG